MKTQIYLKTRCSLLFALCGLALTALNSFAQSTGDYRSAASGNLNALATWERYNGTTWAAPTSLQGTPTNGSGVITVQSPHTVTLNINVSVDQMTIQSGAQVTVPSGITFTVA